MPVDVAALLRDLDVRVTEGSSRSSWLLRAPDRTTFDVMPTAPVERLNALQVRIQASPHANTDQRLLHVGRSATDGVLARAINGEIDILTAEPTRLIHDGRTYETAPGPSQQSSAPQHTGRPAWVRWALQRYLLLTSIPSRQPVIAEALGTTQQSISRAAQALQGLVVDKGEGLFAPDRAHVLEHWSGEYPGPGGQEFGWYGLDPAPTMVHQVVNISARLEEHALVSGDVAADMIAPWKRPMSGRVYVSSPIDLEGDGFVPAPLEEANLVTCVPRDPTLWRLVPPVESSAGTDDLPIADAAVVYWDLLMSRDQDSNEAAVQVSRLLIEDQR